MALWTLIGLAKGKATTPWPAHGDVTGQEGFFGMPRYNPDLCEAGCSACAEVCPTEAIRARRRGRRAGYRLRLLRGLPALHGSVPDRTP